MKRYLPLVLLLLMARSSILTASDKATREGQDLVEQAELNTNIFELPSFQMKASVRVENKGKPVDGSYILLWNGPDQWRGEIILPGYSEVKGGSKGVVFFQKSKEVIKEVRDRKMSSVKVECVEIASQNKHTRDVCVDASTGALVRPSPFLDRELMPVGTKLFPRFLSYVENGKPLDEVQVTELKITEQLPSSAFEPPVGAASKPGCINPNPVRLIKKVS